MREQRTAISHVDFYADDWLSGTFELSVEQRGVFITICALYYAKQGRVPDNDHWLAGMCNMSTRKWRKIKFELVSFGKIEIIDGFIYQERAEIELENALKAKSMAQEKGSYGGKKSAEIRAKALKRNNTTSSPASSPAQAGLVAGVQPPSPSPSPIEDKDKGIDKSIPKKKPRKTQIPDDWEPNGKAKEIAIDEGYSQEELNLIADNFKNYAASKGVTNVKWDSAFYNWIRSTYTRQDIESRRGASDGAKTLTTRAINDFFGPKLRAAGKLETSGEFAEGPVIDHDPRGYNDSWGDA